MNGALHFQSYFFSFCFPTCGVRYSEGQGGACRKVNALYLKCRLPHPPGCEDRRAHNRIWRPHDMFFRLILLHPIYPNPEETINPPFLSKPEKLYRKNTQNRKTLLLLKTSQAWGDKRPFCPCVKLTHTRPSTWLSGFLGHRTRDYEVEGIQHRNCIRTRSAKPMNGAHDLKTRFHNFAQHVTVPNINSLSHGLIKDVEAACRYNT